MALRIRVPCPAARMTTRGALAMWREYTGALDLDLPRFGTRRARAGQTLDTIVLLGSRQVVRQRTLDPPLEGSNPSSPANLVGSAVIPPSQGGDKYERWDRP